MSSGRRRSARLIQSPSLFNWTKKPPAYVNLTVGTDDDNEQRTGGRTLRSDNRYSTPVNRLVGRGGFVTDDLDVRNVRGKGKMLLRNDLSDSEEDFVTPGEFFGNSAKSLGKGGDRKMMDMMKLGSRIDDNSDNGDRIVGSVCVEKHDPKPRKRLREVEQGTESKMISYSKGQKQRNRETDSYADNLFNKVEQTATPRGSSFALKRFSRSVGRRANDVTPKSKNKVKKLRTYEGYIQKKFSPAIMTDVIVNLSKEQSKWVQLTGFGELLNFRMMCYTHTLAFKVVESFNGEECWLDLGERKIRISDNTVYSVIGLPIGKEVIKFDEDQARCMVWGEQFPGHASSEITPKMVRDKILESRQADTHFKLNFLVLMYNFFIKSNQNRFLTRDVLHFSGGIDECGKYNWCRVLIEKLKETHSYWAAKTTRNFTGSLPFLIYLYVSKVRNPKTSYVPITFPSYIGWSDMILRERQKYEKRFRCFGVGELVKLLNGKQDERIQTEDRGRELVVENASILRYIDNAERAGDIMNISVVVNDNEQGVQYIDGVNNIGLRDDALLEDGGNLSRGEHVMDMDGRLNNKTVVEEKSVVPITKVAEKHTKLMTATEYMLSVFDKKDTVCSSGASNLETMAVQNLENETPKMLVNKQNERGTKVVAYKETPKVYDIQAVDFNSTQGRFDEAIESHYKDDTYLKGFKENLKQLDEVYGRCLTDFEVTFALYPNDPRLAELKSTYSHFFEIFGDSSPITKNTCVGTKEVNEGKKAHGGDKDEYIPNFSLGLSQLTPKNLQKELEVSVKSQLKERCGGMSVANAGLHIEGEKVCKNTEMMRWRREVKVSHVCSRVIDVEAHVLTTEEKNVWEWLYNVRQNQQEYLFVWNNRMCTRGHFQSMLGDNMVESTVIDTWTYLLNENETLKDYCSPLRLFLTSETTYGPLSIDLSGGDLHEKIKRDAMFNDNMEHVIQMVSELHRKEYELKDFDMFVFPIYDSGHHYIICYNMKKPRMDIIDNRVQSDTIVENTYGDLPSRLHQCFCQFLEIYNLPNMSEIVNLEPRVVRVGWQTMFNSVDCGIFVMRHMETYMGNLYKWKAGLRVETDNQRSLLNKLRIIYSHRLLTWSSNKKNSIVMENVSMLAKGKKIVG